MRKLILFLCVLLALQVEAQTTFQRIYSDINYSDFSKGVCLSHDGKYIIASQRYDNNNGTSIATLTKINEFGNVMWRKEFPGINLFNAISLTQDDGFIVSGNTDTLIAGDYDFCFMKIDSSGNPQWCKVFGNPDFDFGTEMVQTADGQFVFTGTSNSNGNSNIIKTDNSGNLLWDKLITDCRAGYITSTNDGGVMVSGIHFNNGINNLVLIKLDSAGQVTWTQSFGENIYGGKTLQASDGGYICSGAGQSASISYGFMLLKTDSMGNLQWSKVYSDGAGTPDLIITSDGNYVMAGTYETLNDSASIYLIKTNPQGDTLWTRFYEIDPQLGFRGESTYNIIETPDGGLLIGGEAIKDQPYSANIYLLKTDMNGNADCNIVHRPITIESITPSSDTSILISSGITSSSINPIAINSSIGDTILCLHDGIEENEIRYVLELFPNPSNDHFFVKASAFFESDILLEIKDIMGRTIVQRNVIASPQLKIDISNLNPGVYNLSLTGRKSFGTSLFIKQ